MQVCGMDLRVGYRIVRSFVLILTRNNGSEPKNIVQEGGLSQGEKSGFSLLSSQLYTLRPPVSCALSAKRRLHRTNGAFKWASDGEEGTI